MLNVDRLDASPPEAQSNGEPGQKISQALQSIMIIGIIFICFTSNYKANQVHKSLEVNSQNCLLQEASDVFIKTLGVYVFTGTKFAPSD